MITVTKKFTFEAAHYLPKYKGLCHSMHGHSYKLFITVTGDVINGMVIDFKDLSTIVKKRVIKKLDHTILNNIDGLRIPTAENTCYWIWDKLDKPLKRKEIELYQITLYETEDSFAILTNTFL